MFIETDDKKSFEEIRKYYWRHDFHILQCFYLKYIIYGVNFECTILDFKTTLRDR